MNDRFYRRLAGIAALTSAFGVMMGAFGAHALKSRISGASLDVLKTGVLYLFIHALAILLIAVMLQNQGNQRLLKISGVAFLIGILLFSGSLFLISTREVTGLDIGIIGVATPIGGLCFITGWACFSIWGLKTRP